MPSLIPHALCHGRNSSRWPPAPLELQKGPSQPCCNSRSSPTYPSPLERKHESPASSRGAPFRPPSSRGGILPLRGRERIPGVSVTSQEEALSTGKARGTPGSCQHSQSPPDVSVHSRETCFSCAASTFKPKIDSHHGGTWDSPVGKPPGQASRESHRSLDLREGKRDTASTARQESARACPNSRRGLTPLGRLQKYPKIHVSTGEESSGSGTDSTQGLRPWHRRERNRERTPSNSHGDWPFLRPPEQVPEVPVLSREHMPQLQKIQEVLPSRRIEDNFQ